MLSQGFNEIHEFKELLAAMVTPHMFRAGRILCVALGLLLYAMSARGENPLMVYGLGKIQDVSWTTATTGSVAVTLGSRGFVRWNATSGQQASMIEMLGHTPYCMDQSPTGDRIVTGGRDRIARLWNAETGALIRSFVGHTDVINDVALSPNGQRIVTVSSDTTAKVWNAETGELLHTFPGAEEKRLWAVDISPDGTTVVTGGSDWHAVLRNLETGQQIRTYPTDSYVYDLEFSSDGSQLIGGGIGEVYVWNTASGALVRTMQGVTFHVYSTSLSPDGNWIAGAEYGRPIQVWSTSTGALLFTLSDGSLDFETVQFSPDGSHLLAENAFSEGVIWDVQTKAIVQRLTGHCDSIGNVQISEDNTACMAASGYERANIWDLVTGELKQSFGHPQGNDTAAFAPDGSRLLNTVSGITSLHLWDLATGQQLWTTSDHYGAPTCLAITPDGQTAAGGFGTGQTILWDMATGSKRGTLQTSGYVRNLGFSRDGNTIWISNQSGMELHSLAPGGMHGSYQIPVTPYNWLVAEAASPDMCTLLTADRDKTIRLWDATAGTVFRTVTPHTTIPSAAAFSPNGRKYLTCATDGEALLWDTQTGDLLHRYQCPGPVRSIAFSSDGTSVVMGDIEGMTVRWSVPPDRSGVQSEWLLYESIQPQLQCAD